METEKIEYGLSLRQSQQDARDKLDQAAEIYGRFLNSLTVDELEVYVRVTRARDSE